MKRSIISILSVLVLLSMFLTAIPAAAADTGAEYPGTFSTTSSTSPYDDENWTSPENVGADDGANASITDNDFDDGDYSYVLRATNFGFSIPAGNTITGIMVEIERYSANNQRGRDDLVQLTKNGTARVGDNKASGSEWPTSVGVATYGGPTDLWGTTWTLADINASTFGVHLAARATDNNADIYVDFIRITVYYSTCTDWKNPTLNVNSGVSNPDNAYSDGSGNATFDTTSDNCTYYGYDFTSIPAGSTINGITVMLDAAKQDSWCDGDNSGTFSVVESWNNGSAWTGPKTQSVNSTSYNQFLLGGSSDDWGHTPWTLAELANFRVKISWDDNCPDGYLDWVPVMVCYTAPACTNYYHDNDDDNYGAGAADCQTSPPAYNYATVDGDCDDTNPAINPLATEVCDGVDNNCNGSTDEGVTTTFYADADGDTFGDPSSSTQACSIPGGYVGNSLDCDDTNSAINPLATEVCDLVDNDCDGAIDEEGAPGCSPYFLDADDDGFGVTGDTRCLCGPSGNYTAPVGGDCNDSNAAINPNALEVCDGIDNDCDTLVDSADASFVPVQIQLGILLDGSASFMESNKFNTAREALADSIYNDQTQQLGCIAADGTLELTVVQFAGNLSGGAQIMVGPVVITPANAASVANQIRNITAVDGFTPLACGIYRIAQALQSSPCFDAGKWQVIDIITDGAPNRCCGSDYSQSTCSCGTSACVNAMISARAARDAILAPLGSATLKILVETTDNASWFIDATYGIVWPEPGVVVTSLPLPDGGWAYDINSWGDFPGILCQKLGCINCGACQHCDGGTCVPDTNQNGSSCAASTFDTPVRYCFTDGTIHEHTQEYYWQCNNGVCTEYTQWINDHQVEVCAVCNMCSGGTCVPDTNQNGNTCAASTFDAPVRYCYTDGTIHEHTLEHFWTCYIGTCTENTRWTNDHQVEVCAECYQCDNGSCVPSPAGTACGSDYTETSWVYYCVSGELWKHQLFHDFSCETGVCTDHTSWVNETLVDNCDSHDGWYDTATATRWVDAATPCQEKEQKEQEYRDYFCDAGNETCDYTTGSTQWVDTGNTQNKLDGTDCGDCSECVAGVCTPICGDCEECVGDVCVNTCTASAGDDYVIRIGESVVLGGDPTTSCTGCTFLWAPITGLNNATLANPIASPTGTTTYTVTVTQELCTFTDSVTVTVMAAPAGGGLGPEKCYLVIDMLGERTLVEMNCCQNTTAEECQAYDEEEVHLLAFPEGTLVRCGDCEDCNCYPRIIVMSQSDESLTPPEGMTIVGPIYDLTGYKDTLRHLACSLATYFDPSASVLLHYDPDLLPEGAFNPVIAFFSHTDNQWVILPPDTGIVAEVGVATGLADYFASPFAVLASVTPPATPTPPPPALTPAHFVASGLSIAPAEIKAGESVTISLNVANDGEQAGTYLVELKINGNTIDSKVLTLDGGQSEPVSFAVSAAEAGTYEATVSGLSGSFTVEATSNWWIYLIIAAVVILAGVLVLLIRRRA